MQKQLFILISIFFSTQIFSLNFNKELQDLKKIASNIGSDAWDRASFERNALTETSKYLECLEKNDFNNNPNAYPKCKKDTQKELGQQLSQDGKNLLKLFVAGIAVKAVASTIEHAAKVVISEETSKNIAKSCSTIPENFIIATAVPLGLNFISSMIVNIYLSIDIKN